MTTASQFFIALAQVTAVAIGFVIAFAAALYTIRRNRIRGQSQAIITQIESFIEEYQPQLEASNRLLRGPDIDDPRFIEGPFYSAEYSDNIESWAEQQSDVTDSRRLEAYVWGNVYWALRLMDDIEESSEPDNVFQYFDLLSHPINNLHDVRSLLPPNPQPEMKRDYETIASKMYNLRSKTRESKIGCVILKSKILFFIGVIFPISLLLTIPESITTYELTGTPLFLLQMIILSIVIVTSWSIFTDLRNLMAGELF